MSFYEEVVIEDMDFDEEKQIFFIILVLAGIDFNFLFNKF